MFDPQLFTPHGWRHAGAAASFCIVALLAACGGGDAPAPDPGSGTNPPSAAAPYTLAVAAAPLRAHATPDATRAVTQEVPLTGGTLSATGADGTVYTLEIPGDALTNQARIRMTPLAALQIDDLPAERSFGVTLEPEGQQFFKPVTLTITPPAGVSLPVQGQIPVSWSGANNTVSLAVVDPDPDRLELKILHFSGYAILFHTKGFTASISAVRDRLGGAAEDRIDSAVAERIAQSRQGESAFSLESLEDLRVQFVEQVIKPRLAAAGSSCAASKLAADTVVGYDRHTQLLGLDQNAYLPKASAQLLYDLLASGSVLCMKEEYEICRDEHILPRILGMFIGVLRQAALLGFVGTDEGTTPSWLIEAESYVGKCLKFELQFDSDVTYSRDRHGSEIDLLTMRERVESRVKIGYEMTLTEPIPGSLRPVIGYSSLLLGRPVPLIARDYQVGWTLDCARVDSSTAIGGTLAVGLMSFASPDPYDTRPVVSDFGISLVVSPNRSTYAYTQAMRDPSGCINPVGGSDVLSWSTEGFPVIADQFISDAGVYVTGWTVQQNSATPATKEMPLTHADTGTGEYAKVTLRMVLFHTPER